MRRLALCLMLTGALVPAGSALGKTSHAGWPRINGHLKMHKTDASGVMRGHPRKHNELLGGHGSDTIFGGDAGDVIWGDYKAGGQPTSQVDSLHGGAGRDFIYASHGANYIFTGGGRNVVHAHFGHGEIHCQGAGDIVFISHRGRRGWKLVGCRRVSYRTLGY